MKGSLNNKRLSGTRSNKQIDNDEKELYQTADQVNDKVQPLTSGNTDLRYRLYDKGFNIRTMPSVKRPETAQSIERPLSAKLYSFKNKLTTTTYQPQSTILHSHISPRALTATKSRRPDMNPEYDANNQYRNIPLSQLNFGHGGRESELQLHKPSYNSNGNDSNNQLLQQQITPSGRDMTSFRKSPPFPLEDFGDQRPMSRGGTLYRPTSTNSLATLNPLNKLVNVTSPVASQVSQGGTRTYRVRTANPKLRSQGNLTGANFFSPRSQMMSQPLLGQQTAPTTAVGALTSNEIHQSKTIIDKISGKHAINPRFLVSRGNPQQVVKGNALMMESQMRNTQFTEMNDNEGLPQAHGSSQDFMFERTAAHKTGALEAPKRQPTNLDKYIELILKNVTNVDEFIYLLKNNSNDLNEDDPYDLKVIDYTVLKEKDPKEYYTISMKGLCHYQNGKPTEFISLAYWLKERETYDKIKSLTFFVNFRRWKTLKMWRRNINKLKTTKCARALEEKLFILNPILSKILRMHRELCCELEQLRFIDLNKQVEIQRPSEFANRQEKKRQFVSERLQEFSKRARDNVREGFKLSLDELRKKKSTAAVIDEYSKKDATNQAGVLRLKESAYENLGFPDNMDYEKRSELRKECSRFIRFSYLVDFLALEALSSIYNNSIRDLVVQLEDLNANLEVAVLKGDQQMIQSREQEPLFFVKLEFHRDYIPDYEIYEEEVDQFALPPHGKSKISEFNLLVHAHIVEEFHTDEELTDIELEKKRMAWEARPLKAKRVNNISQFWLSLNPNLESIFSIILKSIAEGMNSLQVFERWSKHEELSPYFNVLEEWDDRVGDDWDEAESNYLDPQDWIDINAYDDYGKIVHQLIEISFNKAESFKSTYNSFLERCWENDQYNQEVFRSELLVDPDETIGNAIALLKYEKEEFEKNLPHTADIGLLRVDCKDVKDKILPSPSRILADFQKFLPEMLRTRVEEIRVWLNNSIMMVKSVALTIEDFVKQSKALDRINSEFPGYKDRLEIVKQIYRVLEENEFDIKKEDKQKRNDTAKYQTDLQNVLIDAEERKEKYKDKFIKELAGDNGRIPKMNTRISSIQSDVMDPRFLSNQLGLNEAIDELEKLYKDFKVQEELSKEYNVWEQTLEMAVSSFDNVKSLKQEVELKLLMWKSLKEWKEMTAEWMICKFRDINAEQIKSSAIGYENISKKCSKRIQPNPILDELKQLVFDFKESVPVVMALRNPRLTKDHIEEIKAALEKPDLDVEDEGLTLKDLLDMNIVEKSKEINEISTQATQEANLASQIKIIEDKWKQQELITKPYKEELLVIGEVDEVQDLLDQSLANINNILGSRYLKRERERANRMQKDLLLIQETLDEWLTCQKNWMYLENIFRASDIKGALKKEAQQFEAIDKFFKKQINNAARARFVQKVMAHADVLKKFKEANEGLDRIQKELEDYLRMKRDYFPRFYFLSNDELLEILANATDPYSVQPHLRKCFDNINRLDFGENRGNTIYAMISSEGEMVKFSNPVLSKGNVENWLTLVQEMMIISLKNKLREAIGQFEAPDFDRKKWVLEHPGQIVATGSQIMWAFNTENSIQNMDDDPNALYNWLQLNMTQLNQLTELVKSNLPSIKHKIIVALITTDVHARDIIENLTNEGVSAISEFAWQQQLRYYWDDQSQICKVRQVNAELNYGYEYMGATSRLVITPLTDRCWMTITGALNIKLGAAPAGPAGTGKTESTKDLAKGLGTFCVVFNCSEQIEYQMMGRLFSGLAQQGAWACLDEFNRIDVEVLSVIAQQLLDIRRAKLLLSNEKTEDLFEFMGRTIKIKPACGVFITMNPGYAGRTELPDNLKVLFRPVSMMIPDYGLIAEIMLFAEGFSVENAKNLSKKMVRLYKLSSEQLSQQDHYDFGMRAVKSVLVMAGSLKRADQNLSEDVVLIRAMRDSNIPKFLKDDIPLFQAIIQDLFPGVEIPLNAYGDLEKAIRKSIEQQGLQPVAPFITKVIQLFETFNVRFGVMLVGVTGSGKTRCYKTLQMAMTALHEAKSLDQRYQKVEDYVLNPKSITMGELYGEVNPFTKEWTDGLASFIMRDLASRDDLNRKWVVFDGPVDALWIENMNTVLDDNMMLCLANGQRIKLRNEMRMLFEVQDLSQASPATVSRCGMVYLTFEDLGWKPFVESWYERVFAQKRATTSELLFDEELKKTLMDMFDLGVTECLKLLREQMQEPVITSDLQLIQSLTNLLEAFISESFGFRPKEKIDNKKKFINYAFVFAFTWSLGGSVVETKYRDMLDKLVRNKFSHIIYPNMETIHSVYLDVSPVDGKIMFRSWKDRTPEFVYGKDMPYFEIVVPTPDTVAYTHVIGWLLDINKPVFATGKTGVGKSIVIQSLLGGCKDTKKIDTIPMMFSAQTSSLVTQTTIESKLQKLKRDVLGAIGDRRNVIFIDDVNMPTKEKYGAQPPIELLRQLIDKGGFYDRKKLGFIYIESTNLCICAAPPGGGRSELTPRFTRHFNMVAFASQNAETLKMIFKSILSGFLSTGFSEGIRKISDQVVFSTIEIYETILKEKKPIPSKFHYTFNLRDVSKVFQGILMARSVKIKEPEQMARLWIHEVTRVFYDRLINKDDREWFNKLVEELLNRSFKGVMKINYDDLFVKNKIYFGDLMSLDDDERYYVEINDKARLLKVLDDKQDDYNSENSSPLKLVFFEDAIEHILRISRVLRQPRGNAMLIGVGGSGKQSLTKLSSYLLKYKLFQIVLTNDYDANAFREDMKKLMVLCGVQGHSISFLFTDTQIVTESFLEDINNLLNSGEVPNLFINEEKEKIVSDLREAIKINDSDEAIYRVFIDRVRDRLHIILCMSPVGDALRVRCRKFPSLVDCCTLDWFSAWPREALLSVSSRMLYDIPLNNELARKGLTEMCPEVHLSAEAKAVQFEMELKRKIYTTPKSYLDIINLFITSLTERQEALNFSRRRLATGLKRLEETNKLVSELRILLTQLQPELEVQSKETELALIAVEADSEKADKQQLIVEQETFEVKRQEAEISLIAGEAQLELDKVVPEMEEAERAVEKIADNKKDFEEFRQYKSPPAAVKVVLEAVAILIGEHKGDKEFDWKSALSMLNNLTEFIKRIVNLDKNNLPEQRLIKLKKYLPMKEMDVKFIEKTSIAVKPLCIWVRAVFTYSIVAKKVEPKRKKKEELEEKLNKAREQMLKKESELAHVVAHVEHLKEQLNEKLEKKKSLEDEMEKTKGRLIRADKLTTLLADEGVRWAQTVKDIESELSNVVGDTFLATAILSYNGPFSGPYRTDLVKYWIEQIVEKGIPLSTDFDFVKVMGDPILLREWMMNGLPSDTVSLENSIICMKGYRWPLMIDPQLQANSWIRKTFENANLKVLKFTDANFANVMKGALQNGFTVLIQDIGDVLDPSLNAVFDKQFYTDSDGRVLIRFGDGDIDYDNNFRLFLTTKNPNPNYLPDVFIKVTVINFTVTLEGLEDQLLGDVVKNERPEIEQARDENIVKMASYRKELKRIENQILKGLSESTEDSILDDEELIQTLENSKHTSQEISVRVKESIELEKTIDQTRLLYKGVSIRGSLLYFVVKDLSLIDPMYQYSLQYIKRLFRSAMENTAPEKDLDIRLSSLTETITKTIYTNVCRGLFEAHKQILSFLTAISIQKNAGSVSEAIWNVFLRGSAVFDRNEMPTNPDKTMFKEKEWDLAYYMDKHFESFNGLTSHIVSNVNAWRDYAGSYNPIEEVLPGEWEKKLNLFEKIVILKIFRPEKLLYAVSNYVYHELDPFYTKALAPTVESVFVDSDRKTPIIFVLSQGADPTGAILKFATDTQHKIHPISLGQGQDKFATEMIEMGKRTGDWILLQNCHLARTWMPALEIIIENIGANEAEVHEDFRLFLTSMPDDSFPVSILQNGVKLTTEPPRGIVANMQRAFADIKDEWLDDCTKPEILHKLAFGLSFFHAVLMERRKFGPLGFNIRYEFNDSDLETSRTVLKMLISEQEMIPWDAMLYVTGHINYGGRVTDDWDRRCLLTILKRFYTPEILEEKYYFSENDQYYAPSVGSVESYQSYISSLPDKDDPEVFGMHENANIAFQSQESDKMISTILSIQPRIAVVASGKSSDEVVLELCKQIKDSLPFNLSKTEEGANKELFIEDDNGLIPSLSTVLLQEMTKYNLLLDIIRTSLDNLNDSILGLMTMSQELDAMYSNLLNNQVPKLWADRAYPSLKPLASWIKDLELRIKFMREWLTSSNTAGPICFWLSGFFFPQGFLTGVLQTHARKHFIAIDKLNFAFRVLENDKDNVYNRPTDGVYVYGLYLEGASWDRKKKIMIDQIPGEMHTYMPVIYFNPVLGYESRPQDYQCPVYKTSVRAGTLSTTGHSTNFIIAVDLPTQQEFPPESWVLRGSALLCQLND